MTDMTSIETDNSPRSRWADIWLEFRNHKGAVVGIFVFLIIVAMVSLGQLLWHSDPQFVDIRSRNQGTSFAHPLGTDQLGRDMLARMISGGKVSLAVGFTAMILSIVLGTFVGVLAGYFRRLDGPLMRITDLFLSLPLLPLLLVIVMLFRETLSRAFGAETGAFLLIVLAIALTSWMQGARIVRGEVIALKEQEFILAARSVGTSSSKMLTRHVLPNIISPIMVSATLGIAKAIITESSLSFLGLGFPPDFPTWGRLLYDGVEFMQTYPGRVVYPGVAIALIVLSVNYVGDGIRDALNPRVRKR
jgi:peptide/nickel transport system permease protein